MLTLKQTTMLAFWPARPHLGGTTKGFVDDFPHPIPDGVLEDRILTLACSNPNPAAFNPDRVKPMTLKLILVAS